MRSLIALRIAVRRALRADPIPAGAIAIGAVGAFGMIRGVRNCRIHIEGDSMRPLLAPGDRVVVAPARRQRLQPGDLVVAHDPRRPQRRMVKRLVSLDGVHAWLRGDNPAASTDSRTFGWVALPRWVGRPIRRYAPVGRVGPLPRNQGAALSDAVTTTRPEGAGGSGGALGCSATSRTAPRGR